MSHPLYNAKRIHLSTHRRSRAKGARWSRLRRLCGDSHGGSAFAQSKPGNARPVLTKMLVSMAFAIWFMLSILRDASPPYGGNRLQAEPPWRWASFDVGDSTTGSTGIIISVTANGWLAGVWPPAGAFDPGRRQADGCAILPASRPHPVG